MRLHANTFFLGFVLVALLSLVGAQNDDSTSSTATNTNDATTTGTSATKSASTASATSSDAPVTRIKSSSSASASDTDAPVTRLTSSTGSSSYDGIIDAPTVTNAIPTYPAPTVPPTGDAPFMQKSNLPQGTVFICVGAVLAFALAIILVWRVSVAYLLRRGMKQASANGYMPPTSDYSHGGGKNTAFYSQGFGSTMSLDPLTSSSKGATKGGFVPESVRQSLFFSPTAGSGAQQSANRGSGYLPAGYYAAGASVAGGGVAGNGRPISMADFTNNRPQSSVYQPQRPADSPRDSPLLRPSDPPYGRLSHAGMSTASLGQKSDGRAPSAYLDDLFDYPPVSQNSPGK